MVERQSIEKHKSRVAKRVSPAKKKMLTEEELKVILSGIFDRYDADKSGSIDIREFRRLINDIGEKRTGILNLYSM